MAAAAKPRKKAPVRKAPISAPARSAKDAEAEKKLLADIWARPEDKNLLRVYADWLAERGDERAEYIELSLLEKPTDEQSERASALLKKHRGEWVGEARPFVRSWSDSHEHPGFLDHVWTEAPKFIEAFDRLLALGPWLVLHVTGMRTKRRETEAKMAKLPLHRVYDLDLGSNALDDKSIATLAPALKGIRALHLDGNNITAKGFETLGNVVDTIEYLCVCPQIALSREERAQAVNDFAETFLKTPGFRSLVHLHFFRCGSPSPELCERLRALPKMKKLNISEYTEWAGLRDLS